MSFLAIDVGNTRLKWACYASGRPGNRPFAQGAVFLENIDDMADTVWRDLPAPTAMLGCAVAGEAVRRRVEEQLEIWDIEPRWVSAQSSGAGVVNGYDHPSRLGADRWVAAIGARHHVLAEGRPRPALVVMVGTAATVDAIDTDGKFMGGLILPGFGLMLKALEMGTAGLKAPTGEVVDFPTNTSDALMSGGAHAMAGAIERMHRKLQEHAGQEPVLLMTGGAVPKLTPILDLPYTVVDTLIFDGLLALQAERIV